MTHEELLNTPEYTITFIELKVFNIVTEYMNTTGMNVDELANKTEMSKTFINNILKGEVCVSFHTLIYFLNKIGYKTTITFDKI